MILDLLVTKTDDGYTAEVPSIKGCESWDHQEEEVISKIIELVKYYLQAPELNIKIDLARKEKPVTVYKLIFNK